MTISLTYIDYTMIDYMSFLLIYINSNSVTFDVTFLKVGWLDAG